jgi:hypothetical protein
MTSAPRAGSTVPSNAEIFCLRLGALLLRTGSLGPSSKCTAFGADLGFGRIIASDKKHRIC